MRTSLGRNQSLQLGVPASQGSPGDISFSLQRNCGALPRDARETRPVGYAVEGPLSAGEEWQTALQFLNTWRVDGQQLVRMVYWCCRFAPGWGGGIVVR